MPPAPGAHDLVAIGLNEKGKHDATPKAKVRNFKPRLYQGRLELSTFCLDELDDGGAWGLLDMHLDKPAVGRAELAVAAIRDSGLTAHPDWIPERHVNIIDWPPTEEAQTALAQTLHGMQRFVVRPVTGQ